LTIYVKLIPRKRKLSQAGEYLVAGILTGNSPDGKFWVIPAEAIPATTQISKRPTACIAKTRQKN
jgi:hypothetical protein